MHEVFAEKRSVNPVKESLGSTFKPETLTLKKEPTVGTFEEYTDIIKNIPRKEEEKKLRKKEKTRFQEDMLRLVEEKKSESLKLKKEIWEEKKKIATKKIEAMNNLAAALKEVQKDNIQ